MKNSYKKRYCFGSQKCIYTDMCSYDLKQLNEEVMNRYQSKSDLVFSMRFLDKYATEQTFIDLDSDDNFGVMLSMYEEEKEVTVYVTAEKDINRNEKQQSEQDEVADEALMRKIQTIVLVKKTNDMDIAPMPGNDQWVHVEAEEKIYPPIIKRPPGRPKKDRIIPPDEPKRRHKRQRCGMYGHHQKTCKNPTDIVSTSQSSRASEFSTPQNASQASTSKRGRGKNLKAHRSKKSKSCNAMQYQAQMQNSV